MKGLGCQFKVSFQGVPAEVLPVQRQRVQGCQCGGEQGISILILSQSN